MAKIVVLAAGKAADEAKAALEGAGVECEVVEPTAQNLLHIVIGMVGDDEPEEKEEKKEKEEKVEEPPVEDEEPAPVEEPAPAEDEEFKESLGMITVDGERIEAFKSLAESSVLYSPNLQAGAKTTYSLNESVFSFWPSNTEKPAHRMIVEQGNHRASVELEVRASKINKSFLAVGKDLADLFTTK